MKNNSKFLDGTVDKLTEFTSSKISRTGNTVSRISYLIDNKVDPRVIALQLSINSERNNPDSPIQFTADEMVAIKKIFDANTTRTALSKKQTRALAEAQLAETGGDLGFAC